MNDTTQEIRNLISHGKTKLAVEVLLRFVADTNFYSQALQISNRYNNLNERIINGLIPNDEIFIENAKITHAVIELTKIVEEDKVSKKNPFNSHQTFKNVCKYVIKSLLIALPLFIAAVYIEMISSGYSFDDASMFVVLFTFVYFLTIPVIIFLFSLPPVAESLTNLSKAKLIFPPLVLFIGMGYLLLLSKMGSSAGFILDISMYIAIGLYIISYIFLLVRIALLIFNK